MTELELYKFINDRECEWYWDYHYDGVHLILFLSPHNLKDFCKMLGNDIFIDGLPCEQRLLSDGSVGLTPFEDICDYYGIDAKKVFSRKDV